MVEVGKFGIKLNDNGTITNYIVLGKKSKKILFVAPCNQRGEYQANLKTEIKEKDLFFDIVSLKNKMLENENKRHNDRIKEINEIK